MHASKPTTRKAKANRTEDFQAVLRSEKRRRRRKKKRKRKKNKMMMMMIELSVVG